MGTVLVISTNGDNSTYNISIPHAIIMYWRKQQEQFSDWEIPPAKGYHNQVSINY